MTKLVIEDVDQALMSDLGRMAARNGLTVGHQAKRMLMDAVQGHDRSALVARLRAIAAMTPEGVVQTDSVEMLREDRNR